jgi:hypothetical protein
MVRTKRINVKIWGIEKNVKVCIPLTENIITNTSFLKNSRVIRIYDYHSPY